MKKLLIVAIIIAIFIIGLKLGEETYNTNYLLEQEKEIFESEITNPNNDYQAKEFVPEDNIVNKVAKKIDNTIDKVVEKFKEYLKKI